VHPGAGFYIQVAPGFCPGVRVLDRAGEFLRSYPTAMSDKHRQPDLAERLKEALALERPPLQRALGHRPRLELLAFLVERSDGQPTNEQELAEAFSMGIRLVEYHLKVLQHADLIANIADGQAAGSGYVASATL
jgi:hypothetical protein